MAAVSPTRAPVLLLSLGLPLLAALFSPPPAFAGAFDDEDIDDEDFGPAGGKPAPKKGKGAKPEEEASGPMGDDEDPEWDAPREARPSGGGGGGGFDEDPDFDDPELAPERPKPAPPKAASEPTGPARLKLDAAGKAPLADGFPATVVAKDVDAVVVELPVLVAAKGSDHKGDYWLIADIFVGELKVGETRAWVGKSGIADLGPTFVWVKVHVPVVDTSGAIQLKLSSQPEGGAPKALFTKSVNYKL